MKGTRATANAVQQAKAERFCASVFALSILEDDGDEAVIKEIARIYKAGGAQAMINHLRPKTPVCNG